MSEYEARQALQRVFDQYQSRQPIRRGLLGDSNGTVMVTDRPGWAFIRYRDDLNRLSIVRYLLPEQLADETPVKVGRKYPDDPFEQVLGVDWDMYAHSPTQSSVDYWATPAITVEDLAPGKVMPTDPLSLSVDVRSFLYANLDEQVEYGGGSIDLTGSIPGAGGQHRLTLVYMDLDTDALAAEDGTAVATGTDATAPTVPENGIPLAVVDLTNGDTEVIGDDIYQYKILYGAVFEGIGLEQLVALLRRREVLDEKREL